MNKNIWSLFTLIIVTFLNAINSQAQSCKTGKLDPAVAGFLKSMPADNRTLDELRKSIDFKEFKNAGPPAKPYPSTDVERVKITADSIPVLIFNPAHTKGLPIVIYFHGGGVAPLVPWMEYACWSEANRLKAIVFAVDYRVAPQYKFPAGVNDSYNAFKWISENGEKFNGDTGKIILKGESSGATLAAVICQKAKREGIANRIKLQVMNCPSSDNPNNAQLYPSMQENATGYLLTTAFLLFVGETYADKKDYDNPEFAPILSKDLSGLPPAVLITAEFDPLRDQGAAYADRLRKANVRVWYKCFPGQIHALIAFNDKNNEANTLILNAIKEVLTK